MKNVIVFVSATAILGATGFVSANEKQKPSGYIGLNYVALAYEEDGLSGELDLGVLSGKLGANINRYLAGEVRLGFGVKEDSVSAFGASAELELDNYIGAYLLAGLPNPSPIYPYIVVGATQGELSVSASGPGGSVSDSGSESGFSYGLGAKVDVTDSVHLNAEYMQYLDEDGFEISGFSVGGAVHF